MKQHGNASLTVAQRKLIHELYHSGQAKKSELARRFNVNRKTIDRWVNRKNPHDKPSGPKTPRKVITEVYRKAVIDHRKTHSGHGPITIAYHLKAKFSFANRGTIQRILQQEGLSKLTSTKKSDKL
jgi:transposase-like protein